MNEVEKLVNRGGSGEVSDVDGATGSSVDSTKSDLEGSRGVVRLYLVGESDHKTMKSRAR